MSAELAQIHVLLVLRQQRNNYRRRASVACPLIFIMERTDIINANITLTQNTSGLTYGTDALLLSAFINPKPKGRAVELGSGTGVISLLAAARGKFAHFYAYEVQSEYASLTEKNAVNNGFGDVISVINKDVRDAKVSDIGKEADAVFANPPYMKSGTGERNADEGKYIARHEVYGGIDDFCACASLLLKHGGSFYVVWRPNRISDLILALEKNSLSLKRLINVYNDPGHSPCLVLAEARKGGGSGTFVTKPFFIKDEKGQTEEMDYICERGVFHERYRKE